MNLNLLQTFIEVAELGSFRRAADAIGRTQSAVSMQIQQLEAQLGTKLLNRTTRRVALTVEGEQLLEHVRSAMTDLTAGLRQASGLGARHRGRVAIACAPSVAGTCLPAVMAEFQRAFPEATAQVRELPLVAIVDGVRTQDVDFGIGPPPVALNGLAFEAVIADPICALFLSASMPGLDRDARSVSLGRLAKQPIVLMGGLRTQMETACAQAGIALGVQYEAQQIITLMGLVQAGLGIAVVPRIAVPAGLPPGLSVLPIAALHREVGIITQLGRRMTPIALELSTLLRTHLLSVGAHA